MPDPTQPLRSAIEPRHFVPPSARELRAQAVHRLQVGLFGLAAMLLLVGLANIIMDQARRSDVAAGGPAAEVAASANAAKTSADPLADIGVIPAAEPGTTPAKSNAAPRANR